MLFTRLVVNVALLLPALIASPVAGAVSAPAARSIGSNRRKPALAPLPPSLPIPGHPATVASVALSPMCRSLSMKACRTRT